MHVDLLTVCFTSKKRSHDINRVLLCCLIFDLESLPGKLPYHAEGAEDKAHCGAASRSAGRETGFETLLGRGEMERLSSQYTFTARQLL